MSRTAVAYRVLAWVVGVNLIAVMAGFLGKIVTEEGSWWYRQQDVFKVIDMVHGFLYMMLLVLIAVLASRHRWKPAFTVTTMLLATVPFLSFWVEHRTTQVLRAEHDGPAPPR